MVKSCAGIIRHVLARNLCFHDRIVGINRVEIAVQADRSGKINRVTECEVAVIASLQNLNELLPLFVIYNIEAGILVLTEELHKLFTEDCSL